MACGIHARGARRAVRLAATIGSSLAISATWAATIPVSTCEDVGAGSLRDAVAKAGDGDLVDASHLTCATITLTSGEIPIAVDELTIAGPGMDALTIDASNASRIFDHTGTGNLVVDAMTLTRGTMSGETARGGCIYSAGTVEIDNVTISNCHVLALGIGAGGGVFALTRLSLNLSHLIGNTVDSNGEATHIRGQPASMFATGGGAASDDISAIRSEISGNSAIVSSGSYASGGGLWVRASPFLRLSTIDDNRADFGGGVTVLDQGGPSVISSSTISQNAATVTGGGIYANTLLSIFNSTIAFNTAGVSGAGIYVSGPFNALAMDNTIAASNSAEAEPDDSDIAGAPDLQIDPDHSIVMRTMLPMPKGTLRDDPLLAPLADNGGSTRTHAIGADSPAIDNAHWRGDACDQRDAPRVFLAQDIGAFEYQGDRLLAAGFERCLP
jgi:hypothetical protein